jgi:capsular polysaccharide biosynthesis protein
MYRRTARRTRWIGGLLVVGLTLIGGATGWAIEHARGPEFEASTDVRVQFWGIETFLLTGQGGTVSGQDVADAATLATSPDVLDLAATRLSDGRNGHALGATVTATPQLTSNGVTIVATGTTAATAERTSAAVAQAMSDTLQKRIAATADSLQGVNGGDFSSILQQRAQVLTRSVAPLQVLRTASPVQTGPTLKTAVTLAVVGLAAGVLLMIALVFIRPVVARSSDVQRLTELPTVSFDRRHGDAAAMRLVRRLLDGRPQGQILVVPVDAGAEKTATEFAEWARRRTDGPTEAARLVATVEPLAVVLDPRPARDAVAAVMLVAPQGVSRRVLSDAVALLRTWRAADAVVIPT